VRTCEEVKKGVKINSITDCGCAEGYNFDSTKDICVVDCNYWTALNV